MKTNRDYFSWSQYNLWQTSKREFWKRYVIGTEEKTNRFYDKGEELAIYLATGEIPAGCQDEMIDVVIQNIPKLHLFEEKLEFLIGGKKMLGFVDSSDDLGERFLEYKSGKIAWTQEKVDEWEQLLFYALGFWERHERKIVPSCKLVWVETMETGNGLMYTGGVTTFEREFTAKELKAFALKIEKTLAEIEEYEYTEVELDEEIVDRYAELKKLVEDANTEMELIKMQVYAELKENNSKFGAGENGMFFITERKSWEYTEQLKALQKENAALVAKMQRTQQKTGEAICTINESLTFKLHSYAE